MTEASEAEDIKRRRDRARADNLTWSGIYQDAYDFLCPYRRSATTPRAVVGSTTCSTTPASSRRFAAPASCSRTCSRPARSTSTSSPARSPRCWPSAAGPQWRPALDGAHDLQWFERQLDSLTAQIIPFFLTGEWDNAISELCIDLYIGTGTMLILEGDDDNPIRFVTLPDEEVALEPGPYGDVSGLFWDTRMTRRSIKAAFPRGRFDRTFLEALDRDADSDVVLHQDFVQQGAAWAFYASLDGGEAPISTQRYKTKPFISSRFYRVPGETKGRGPALLALPTVKTLNKAMELSLKNYAIQMLGLWAYRPGGTFNPESAPIVPGGFWAMQSTGGILGPDVQRLDAGGNAAAMSNIILQELRTQVQGALHDEQLPDGGASPKSAAEIVARVSRMKQNYVGAYGRMIHEVYPVALRRVMEIAFNKGLIASEITLDKLLVTVDVTSPIALALKADHYKATIEAMQLVAQLEGPQAVSRRFDTDKLLPDLIRDLGVDSNYVRTIQELVTYDKAAQTKAQASEVTSAMLQAPDKFASALNPVPDQQQAA